MSTSSSRRPGPASFGPADNWPEGPFPGAKDPATRRAVHAAAFIATEVRRERSARYWSQERLADEAGVSRTTVTRLEAGTGWVDLFVLIRITAALDLDVSINKP
ncbi:helix-turn-helix domain-containing protein [Janibacter sp. Y6]|uniref:helix-turn-helix domain-containing protein n=1 Tax=Janibacter sp. Y6 TaxID=2913552 RepID=UPI0034A2D093